MKNNISYRIVSLTFDRALFYNFHVTLELNNKGKLTCIGLDCTVSPDGKIDYQYDKNCEIFMQTMEESFGLKFSFDGLKNIFKSIMLFH